MCLFAFSAYALNTVDLVSNPDAKEILKKKCIRLGTSELLPINFDTACKALEQPQIVQAMQDEFCRKISKNGEVDFPVFQLTTNTYYYVNEDGKRTDIKELYKKQTDEHSYDYIVQASGKRFFGKYDVIVHLQIVNAGDAGIIYSVNVHAWPHNWLTRSSHKIGLTKKFFKKKMRLISWVAREVGTGLCEQQEMEMQLRGIGTFHNMPRALSH
jgi:hypothetical protein